MNANHARPMLAFWLLAILAAAITAIGLREGSTNIVVRAGSPSPVSSTGSPGLLLGGMLRSQPTIATNPLSTATVSSAVAAEHAAGTVVVDAPAKPQHTKASSGGQTATVPTKATDTAGDHAAATATATAKGKTKHQSGGSAKTTATATPATSTTDTTDTTHGNGHGKAKGH